MKPTIIKDKLSTTPPMHGRVEKCKGAKLLAEDISCKSRLDRPLHERMSGSNGKLTDLHNVCPIKAINAIDSKNTFLLRENDLVRYPQVTRSCRWSTYKK